MDTHRACSSPPMMTEPSERAGFTEAPENGMPPRWTMTRVSGIATRPIEPFCDACRITMMKNAVSRAGARTDPNGRSVGTSQARDGVREYSSAVPA